MQARTCNFAGPRPSSSLIPASPSPPPARARLAGSAASFAAPLPVSAPAAAGPRRPPLPCAWEWPLLSCGSGTRAPSWRIGCLSCRHSFWRAPGASLLFWPRSVPRRFVAATPSTRLSRCARCDASRVRNLSCPRCPRLRRAGCPPGSAPGGARCISSACVLRWAGTAAVLWRCPRPDWLPTRWMTLTRRTRPFYFYLLHSGTPPLSLPDRGPWRDVVASSQLPHLGFVGACRLRRRRSLALHLDEASVL